MVINKNALSERDICTKYITPASTRSTDAIIAIENMLALSYRKQTAPISTSDSTTSTDIAGLHNIRDRSIISKKWI